MRLLKLFVFLLLLGTLGCWRETTNQRVKSTPEKLQRLRLAILLSRRLAKNALKS